MRNTAQIIRLLEEVEKEQRELDAKQARLSERRERLLKELFESMNGEKYEFDDEHLIVRWSGGSLPFRKHAFEAYGVLKFLLLNPDEWVSFAEIAEVVYGNDFADIRSVIRGINDKLQKYGFPVIIDVRKQYAKID